MSHTPKRSGVEQKRHEQSDAEMKSKSTSTAASASKSSTLHPTLLPCTTASPSYFTPSPVTIASASPVLVNSPESITRQQSTSSSAEPPRHNGGSQYPSAFSNSQLRARSSPIVAQAKQAADGASEGSWNWVNSDNGRTATMQQGPGVYEPAPSPRLAREAPTPRRKSISPPAASGMRSSPSTLFLHLLYFLGGVCFACVILTTTPSTLSSQTYMHWFKQGVSSHPLATFVATETSNDSDGAPKQIPSVVVPPMLPLCGTDGYSEGEWVFDETITSAPYVSHEWDNVCDKPPEENKDAAAPAKPVDPNAPIPLRPELQWVWKPHNCRLAHYSRENFCKLLNGRNILFMGDSIAGQHLSSFIHLLHEPKGKDNLWIRDEFFRYDMMNVCQDFYPAPPVGNSTTKYPAGVHPLTGAPLSGIRVGFRRNNFLSMHPETNIVNGVEHRKWDTNQSWIGEIAKHNYEIVVLNTGIWVVDEPIYREMLSGIAEYMKIHHPNVILVWRSTQPGHAFCHTHWARPQKRLYSGEDTKGGSARFRWEEADRRNEIAREYFPQAFFDVATQTKLRPDGHMPGECLHYCQPGPVDEWNKFLFHRLAWQTPEFLKQLEEKERQEHQAKYLTPPSSSSTTSTSTTTTTTSPVQSNADTLVTREVNPMEKK